jgi:[ribosomal protein S5]-alanine N-acetyltransferase
MGSRAFRRPEVSGEREEGIVQSDATYFLKTERLGFRPWSLDDLPLALLLWGDLKVTRLIGGPFYEEQVRQRLAKEIASLRTSSVQYWPVFRLADGDFAGCCGLRAYRSEEKIFELGFHFRPAYWGQGLAVESAGAVINLARESIRAARLFAGHHPENLATRKVLEKLGFHFTHEELYPPTGKMHLCYLLEFPK